MELNPITGLVKAVGGIISTFKASPEDKAKATQALFSLQMKAQSQLLEYEGKRLAEQAKIIRAETESGSWLAANWRPITMLTLVACVVLHWLGLTPDSLPDAQVEDLMDVVKIGIGGYVVGRSAEKVTKTLKGVTK